MRASTLMLLLLALGIMTPHGWNGSSAAGPREWVVSGPENLADLTLYIEENLTVAAGGRLVLDNTTLRFNSSEASPLVLEVLAGGELVLRNSTLDGNGSGPYLVRALPGSKLTVSGCTVAHAGTCATVPESSGFLVATALSSIDNTTFRQGAAGLYLWNCSPELSGCHFLADAAGAVLDGSNATLRRCRFEPGGGRGLLVWNGSRARALDTYLDRSAVSVANATSSLDILWSLTVTVVWDTGPPASGALVRVEPSDGPAVPYQADPDGRVAGIEACTATLTAGGPREHGPFNISAESEGRSAWNVTGIESEREVLLTLDRTPPEVTIGYPTEGASINGTPLPASGTAWDPYQLEDQPGILLVEARLDDGPWSAANGTGSWHFGLAGLPEGVHTLTVRAWDRAGNSNLSAVGFEVDLTAPSLDVWPPAGHLSAARNITVRITTDGTAVAFNGTPVQGLVPGRPLEVDWPLDVEGDNQAAVESLDAAGNVARAGLLVVRDTTPPGVRFTSPPGYSVVNTSLVTVAGASSDLHGIVLVEWGPDRENWTRVNGTSEWSFPALLTEGQNTVYVRATDAAGNTATGWLRLDLRSPDTTPPEVRILYPENGQGVASPSMDVTVRAADAGGVRSVQLSLDGANWTNATGQGDWTGRLSLSPGQNTILARAFDFADNLNLTTVSVVYTPPPPDTAPPALVVLYPPAGLRVSTGMIIISGRASDPSGVSSVEVSADGKSWRPCLLTGEDWSGTVQLAPGRNALRVRATDSLGNRAESSTIAVFDRPAGPAIGQSTFLLLLVLVLLALLSVWLLARRSQGRERLRSGAEEE